MGTKYVAKMSFFEKVGRVVGNGTRKVLDALNKYPNQLIEFLANKGMDSKTEFGMKAYHLLTNIALFLWLGAKGLIILILVGASILGLSFLLPMWVAAIIAGAIAIAVTACYLFFGEDIREISKEQVDEINKAGEAAAATA